MMERKKLVMIVIFAVIITVAIVVIVIVANRNRYDTVADYPIIEEEDAVSGELIGTVDSQNEAKELADMYGIELVSYDYGVALFRTKGDDTVNEVIKRGKEKGYPELSPNYKVELD